MFGSSDIDSMEEDDKEDDDKGHQHQVKEKEEVENHLLKKSQAEHLLRQEDKRCQEREAPQDKQHGETEAEEERRLRQSQTEHLLLRQVEKQRKETKEAVKIQDKQQQQHQGEEDDQQIPGGVKSNRKMKNQLSPKTARQSPKVVDHQRF